MNNLNCEFVSLYSKEFNGLVEMAVLPTDTGEVGILKDHLPMIFVLGEGVVKLIFEDKTERQFLINRGFAEIAKDKLIILSDDAINIEDLSLESAQHDEKLARFSAKIISSLLNKNRH